MQATVTQVLSIMVLSKAPLFIVGLTGPQSTQPLDAEETKVTKREIPREQQ